MHSTFVVDHEKGFSHLYVEIPYSIAKIGIVFAKSVALLILDLSDRIYRNVDKNNTKHFIVSM